MAEEARQAEEKAARLAARASVTFAEFWEAEYLPFAAATKKERTVREEEGLYRRELEKPLGSLPVRDISPFMVERLAHDAQGAGKAAATVRHCRPHPPSMEPRRIPWRCCRRVPSQAREASETG